MSSRAFRRQDLSCGDVTHINNDWRHRVVGALKNALRTQTMVFLASVPDRHLLLTVDWQA